MLFQNTCRQSNKSDWWWHLSRPWFLPWTGLVLSYKKATKCNSFETLIKSTVSELTCNKKRITQPVNLCQAFPDTPGFRCHTSSPSAHLQRQEMLYERNFSEGFISCDKFRLTPRLKDFTFQINTLVKSFPPLFFFFHITKHSLSSFFFLFSLCVFHHH